MSKLTLVRRAAQGKELRRTGCFASNRAASELERIGDDALKDVEAFLASIDGSDSEVERAWPGLASVLHVYFGLAGDSSKVDVGAFLLSLHGWLREEATRVVFVMWGPSHNAKRDRELPARLRWAAECLAGAGSERERAFATRLIEHQQTVTRKQKRALAHTK